MNSNFILTLQWLRIAIIVFTCKQHHDANASLSRAVPPNAGTDVNGWFGDFGDDPQTKIIIVSIIFTPKKGQIKFKSFDRTGGLVYLCYFIILLSF